MDRDKVIDIFNELLSGERKHLNYSKGYKLFEEIYELFKEDLEKNNYVRKENDFLVIIKKDENKE